MHYNVEFDDETFKRLKRSLGTKMRTSAELINNPRYSLPLPEEIGIQLTNRCNLRCDHCFQWNSDGFHHRMPTNEQKSDLDIDIVTKIFKETAKVKSNLYLWGGEPLIYTDWDRLVDLLVQDPRWTVMCTNGMNIEERIESIMSISSSLVLLISLDGFEEENDAIRGANSFKRIIKAIELLACLKEKGRYRGEISINCVINESMVNKLYKFLEYFEGMQVNTVYLCFPWYIPTAVANTMDSFYNEKFGWLAEYNQLYSPRINSWHSYQFMLKPDLMDDLLKEITLIESRKWKIRVRFQPALKTEEVKAFILGSSRPAENKTKCLSVAVRMNVQANGSVTTCKFFPEFTVGSLGSDSLAMVWKNSNTDKAREIFSCGLMPVCSKCVLLYLHGV